MEIAALWTRYESREFPRKSENSAEDTTDDEIYPKSNMEKNITKGLFLSPKC